MHLKSLFVHQFRKLNHRRFDFSSGMNAFVGPNARGKTTLLEAIHFLITGSSFRTHRIQELYETGKHRFDIAADFEKGGSESRLTVSVEPEMKQVIYHESRSSSLSVLLGIVIGSVMTPDDSHLVKGSPQARREFINLQIAETDPLYSWHLSRYERAMRQRNALLKSKSWLTCESWEHEMAVSAAYIHQARKEALVLLEGHFQKIYERLQDSDEKVGLKLISHGGESQEEDANYFKKEWARLREKETYLGFTTIGPHKDDLEILIHDKPAKMYGSEGQKQTLLSALKLAEWHRLYEVCEEKPLFMVDDVGLSLDRLRRERLFKELASMGQVFITTTDLRDMPDVNFNILEM